MAQSIPQIYPKLREALEQFLHGKESYNEFRKGTEVDLSNEDIVSMEDLAVACAKPLFWNIHSRNAAEDLLCLLKPVEEELLPPAEPTDRIWEIFAAAETQHRQFGIVAVYAGFERSLPEANELVKSMQAKFKDHLSSFQNVQLQMERQGLLSSELRTKMTGFAKRLKSYSTGFVTSMMTRWDRGAVYFRWEEIRIRLQPMTQRWLWLSAEASQIAAAVKELELPEVNSLGSWRLVSGGGGQVENLEVGSMASGHSVDSQTSCLSGHGGPHCFLPSYLFKSLQSEGELSSKSSVWASAKDLQKGTKILAADGTPIEVVKVEKQLAKRLVDLEIDDAMPFTTTPNHRIMVPKDGEDTVTEATKEAAKLDVGQWVICSDRVAKRVIGIRKYLVEEQEVLAITFDPDKAVACFLPPEEPVVLTKGLTPKPTRRGGMGNGAKHELMSIPDTAAGEYED